MTKKTTATAKTAAPAAVEPVATASASEANHDTGAIDEAVIAAAAVSASNVLIRPTVGRKVWYRPGQQDRHSHMQWIEGEPLDATILAVHSDRCINAQVLDINGTAFTRRSWPLVQQGDPIPDGSYFEWMPYQTGQAAKAA